MRLSAKLKHELKSVAMATLFFGAWIGALILLKTLVLDEYQIGFNGWSKALVGALILAKVVLVLEHVSLGAWVCARPAWVDVLLRTALYALGVVLVLALEHGLKERHAHGGFVRSITEGIVQAKVPHLVVNTLCLSAALLVYNFLAVIRRHLGPGGLFPLFSSPLPEKPSANASEKAASGMLRK